VPSSETVTFGVLSVVVLAGIAGPLLSVSRRVLVPVVVGEIVAGLVLGRSGAGLLHPAQPTLSFLAKVGFAMLMYTAGMHIPLRSPALVRQLRRGASAFSIAAVLAIGAGWLAASVAGVPHAAVYAVVLASGSAAVLVPSLDELGQLENADALAVAAQVSLADVAGIAAVPLVLQPHRALHAVLGILVIGTAAALLFVLARRLERVPRVKSLRRLSKRRSWALDLRLSLLVLFVLCWVATRLGTSILIAGFAVGLVVAGVGGPKRLSRQVTGVAQGFFVPLYFVVLGATIDVRDLVRHGSLLMLAVLLVALNVGLHIVAARATRQSIAAGLAATVELGVPAAVVSLGLQDHVLSPGAGAAIMVAALVSVGTCELGVARLARRARTAVTPTPGEPASSSPGAATA
jgi:Kef-type K+ transport system membrane component KefB